MSLTDPEPKPLDIAEDVLQNVIRGPEVLVEKNLEYPLYGSRRFNPRHKFGEFDVIAIDGNNATGFAVETDTEKLKQGLDRVASARSYLEREGFEHDYSLLLLDDSIATLKDAASQLPDIFKKSALDELWVESEKYDDFWEAKILGELHRIPRTGVIKDDAVLPWNNYDMLKDSDLILEDEDYYHSTEAFDAILAYEEDVLHLTPRATATVHPSDFDYQL